MSGYAVNDLLSNLQILGEISTLDLPGTSLQRLFGWNIASFATPNVTGNVEDSPLRTGQYDIFDVTRRVATGSVPGTAMTTRKPQKVGQTQFTVPRSAEKLPLTFEDMNQRRGIGVNPGLLDRNGERYIARQTRYLGELFANVLEFQVAAMVRGGYYFTQRDDALEHSFVAGDVFVDFQIPASNKDQLNMLGNGNIITASWLTPTTDIPGNILAIHRAFLELTGMGLSHIVLKSNLWNAMMNNNYITAQAGSSNTPFEYIERESAGQFRARLRGATPWIDIHLVDYGLEVWDGSNFTYTELIEDDHALFIPEPSEDWVGYIRGMETVIEGENGPMSNQYGFYPYAFPSHDPAGWNLCAVHNGLPKLVRPKAIAYGDMTP